jgi:phosphoglycolate phosphatase
MPDGARGTVILDLDGTLVDSAPDLADSLDLLMEEMSLAPFGLGATRALIGHGIPALVRGALLQRGQAPDEATLAAVTDRFVQIYAARLTVRTRPYPGATEALAVLRHAGWRLVVCTNKREVAARGILSGLSMLPAFALVAGPDTFGVAKPDPAHLLRTLPESRGENHPAVVVGDSAVDVAAARAAGLPVIAVAWGYARGPAEALGADAVARTFAEVPPLVEALAAPARPLQASR